MSALCTYLDWDSNFFKRRIARVNVNRLDDVQAQQIVTWCIAERIDCVYFLADLDDAVTIRAVEARSFAFVDIRCTLEWHGVPPIIPDEIRLSRPDDIEQLKTIARVNHRDSRFYYDGHFSQAECDALYALWIERSCTGYADAVLVIERDGQPAGYISCHLKDGDGQIGLLGVGEAWHGQRIGLALINASLNWFAAQNIHQVQVVTQGRNVRAQRAYQRCGFITKDVQHWYHCWFT